MEVSASVGMAARAANGGAIPVATDDESMLAVSPNDATEASRPIDAKSEDEAWSGVVTVGADVVVIAAIGR